MHVAAFRHISRRERGANRFTALLGFVFTALRLEGVLAAGVDKTFLALFCEALLEGLEEEFGRALYGRAVPAHEYSHLLQCIKALVCISLIDAIEQLPQAVPATASKRLFRTTRPENCVLDCSHRMHTLGNIIAKWRS
jgi:hypothetical protein